MIQRPARSGRPARRIAGFSLIELLITLSIIAVLTILSVPILIQQRMTANHSMAIGALKTIFAAQVDYNGHVAPHHFAGTLQELGTGAGSGNVPHIDKTLATGVKSSYAFTMVAEPVDAAGLNTTWSAEAHPTLYRRHGLLSFYIDETGLIRGMDILGAPGHRNMPGIDSFN